MNISETLISWYKRNKRDLPWRKTKDPYLVWLSEIILQQTRVIQGLSYYHAFSEKFPTVKDFAAASEQEILKTWQGLGYYSRARNMHSTAKRIVSEFKGEFPASYEELLSLKGIGTYTAAAISSFCFGLPFPVTDGNVQRVIARLFAIEAETDSREGQKEIQSCLNEIFPPRKAAVFNQAVMEFGALQCVPKNPDCFNCVLQDSCHAFAKNKVSELPRKKPKKKPVDKFLHFLFISDSKSLVLEKRTQGIWKNLYQFPVIETDSDEELSFIYNRNEMKKFTGSENFRLEKISGTVRHQLSHQSLHARFYFLKVKKLLPGKKTVSFETLDHYPLPKLIADFLKGF